MTQSKRLALPDCIRGLTLISMIAYHGIWNLVWLYGMDWQWYRGLPGYIWQQSICWTFLLLSGFCWSMGRQPLRRGLTVFGGGVDAVFQCGFREYVSRRCFSEIRRRYEGI